MEAGTKLKDGILYFTKDGMGNVIPFNMGFDFTNRIPAIMTPFKTQSTDVWSAGIARHIKDIAETKEEAKSITY